ncbi:MAG: hypothetical protein ABR587_17240, partial [Candidatus Binatia bacterium]
MSRLLVGAAMVLALALPARALAALCGDAGGDGFFSASDALATLRLAVTGGYDRRGDVMPRLGNGASFSTGVAASFSTGVAASFSTGVAASSAGDDKI